MISNQTESRLPTGFNFPFHGLQLLSLMSPTCVRLCIYNYNSPVLLEESKTRHQVRHPITIMAQPMDTDKKSGVPRDEEAASLDSLPLSGKGDLLSLEHTDPVLNAKMHLVNDVSEIGPKNSRAVLELTRDDNDRPSMRLAGRIGNGSCSA